MIFRLGLLASVLLALVMMTIGSAGEIRVGSGASVSVSEGSSAEGILATDGSIVESSVSSTGVINELKIDPWVRNTKGDYAEIGVTGTNVAGFSYAENFYPGKNGVWVSNAVWAQQWISASWADSLHAYARASNSAGDNAGADLSLSYGSLNGYYNAAYAGPANWLGMDRVASVQQTLDRASGDQILAQTWAVDSVGDAAGASTDIEHGTLIGYSILADAARYSSGLRAAGVSVDSMSASAPYGSINQNMVAIDYWGNNCHVGTYINKGYLYSYGDYYPSVAYAVSDFRELRALQSVDASSTGYGNYLYSNNHLNGNEENQWWNSQRVRFWDDSKIESYFADQYHGYW